MISHLIAVFIGAAFVGVPIGIFVMALIQAGREREIITVYTTPVLLKKRQPEPEGIDWSRIGV